MEYLRNNFIPHPSTKLEKKGRQLAKLNEAVPMRAPSLIQYERRTKVTYSIYCPRSGWSIVARPLTAAMTYDETD